MKKAIIVFLIWFCCVNISYTQNRTDSIKTIPEVVISAPSKPLLLHAAYSVSVINHQQILDNSNQSLVPVLNSVSGVRMEERSPGSYRLSIRGSLLRSPFGIRNIKIYLDEFSLTDAGGNTYLNLIDANSIHSIEILKGPEGSLFGANTGGVILLKSENNYDSSIAQISVKTGSYGLFDQQVRLDKKWNHYSLSINQAYLSSDGYRQNSAIKRFYLQTLQKWNYKTGSIKFLLLGSKLQYETPGGLTLAQFEEDPRLARPSTSTLPGAQEQHAGVYNSTLYGGISNEIHLSPTIRHVIILFGTYTDFKNQFITNYETKKEKTAGLRTYVEFGKIISNAKWNWIIGMEYQHTKSSVINSDNNLGSKGKLQASDDLSASQSFIFSQVSALFSTRLKLEAAISLNGYQFQFKNIYPNNENSFKSKKLDAQLMPRIGISYRIINNLFWRISVSKGYSPPTLAEIRPSDNIIYSDLQSEYGWNYETGFRFKSMDQRWYADFVVFKYYLKNAIVRRTNDTGTEYFINAGGTNQTGVESELFHELVKNRLTGFIRGLEFRNSFTYYDFIFTDYSINLNSYSGNDLTGVPEFIDVSSLKLIFPKRFGLFLSYNYTGKIPLTDDNSVYSSSYQLIGAKLSWEYKHKNRYRFLVSAGTENILDVSYSLGNDINASGSRYYNPAPARSYYGGVQMMF